MVILSCSLSIVHNFPNFFTLNIPIQPKFLTQVHFFISSPWALAKAHSNSSSRATAEKFCLTGGRVTVYFPVGLGECQPPFCQPQV